MGLGPLFSGFEYTRTCPKPHGKGIEKRLNKNAAFDFCEAEYFLAYKNDKLVGRVAAIINHRANKKWDRKSVRFGWIDFINDREVLEALLNAVEEYGRSKGMRSIVGPLGFTHHI